MGMIISVFFTLLFFSIGSIQYTFHFFDGYEKNYILVNEFVWYLAGVLVMIFMGVSVALLILDINLIIFHFWLIKKNKTTFDFMLSKWASADKVHTNRPNPTETRNRNQSGTRAAQ